MLPDKSDYENGNSKKEADLSEIDETKRWKKLQALSKDFVNKRNQIK